MGRIKSAWEIALEKTENIEFDEEKYEREKFIKEGKSLVGSYLTSSDVSLSNVKDKISSMSNNINGTKMLKQGMAETIISNVSLPQDDSYKFRFKRLSEISTLLAPESEGILKEAEAFFDDYLNARDAFIENMEDQIKQAMQSNPQSINSEQYSQIVAENLKKLTAQYSQTLDGIKDALKRTLESSYK